MVIERVIEKIVWAASPSNDSRYRPMFPYGHRTPLLHDCFGPPPSRLLLAREKIDSLDVQIAGHLGLRGGVAKAVEALGDARIT